MPSVISAGEPEAGREHRAGRELTRRLTEVLQLVADGCSNREIGVALSISEQTVKNHLWYAMQRLAVSDRTRAVLEALRLGVIHFPIDPPRQRMEVGMNVGDG